MTMKQQTNSKQCYILKETAFSCEVLFDRNLSRILTLSLSSRFFKLQLKVFQKRKFPWNWLFIEMELHWQCYFLSIGLPILMPGWEAWSLPVADLRSKEIFYCHSLSLPKSGLPNSWTLDSFHLGILLT